MPSLLESPFHPPTYPTQYIAVGYLFGKFEPFPEQPPNQAVKGLLKLKQGITIKAYARRKFWQRLNQKPDFQLAECGEFIPA
jgi:hypothetical protein